MDKPQPASYGQSEFPHTFRSNGDVVCTASFGHEDIKPETLAAQQARANERASLELAHNRHIAQRERRQIMVWKTLTSALVIGTFGGVYYFSESEQREKNSNLRYLNSVSQAAYDDGFTLGLPIKGSPEVINEGDESKRIENISLRFGECVFQGGVSLLVNSPEDTDGNAKIADISYVFPLYPDQKTLVAITSNALVEVSSADELQSIEGYDSCFGTTSE